MPTAPTTSVEPHHTPHHHALDTAPAPQGATGLKGVLLPVGIVLIIGSIFVSVFLAAFHAPSRTTFRSPSSGRPNGSNRSPEHWNSDCPVDSR